MVTTTSGKQLVNSIKSILPKEINIIHIILALLIGLTFCSLTSNTVEGWKADQAHKYHFCEATNDDLDKTILNACDRSTTENECRIAEKENVDLECKWQDCTFKHEINPFKETTIKSLGVLNDWRKCIANKSLYDKILRGEDLTGENKPVDMYNKNSDYMKIVNYDIGISAKNPDDETAYAWGEEKTNKLLIDDVPNPEYFPEVWIDSMDIQNKLKSCNNDTNGKLDPDVSTEPQIGWNDRKTNVKCLNYNKHRKEVCFTEDVDIPPKGCGCGPSPDSNCEENDYEFGGMKVLKNFMDGECDVLDFGGNLIVGIKKDVDNYFLDVFDSFKGK